MIKDIINEAESKMEKSCDSLRRELTSLRAGRANPSLLDRISVDYYGTPTPINQMANISVPEPRLITIQPWDKGMISALEKAIQTSDLGLNPSNDGTIIRLAIPQLTEERRKELVKSVKHKGEDAKIAVRNVRRDINDDIKVLDKDHTISEDDGKRALDDCQKLTDKYIKRIDEIMANKEKEILEV